MVVGPGCERIDADDAPVRERTMADIRKRIVGAGGGIVGQVDVVHRESSATLLFVASACVDVIRRKRRVLAELPCNTYGSLPAVRDVCEVRRRGKLGGGTE